MPPSKRARLPVLLLLGAAGCAGAPEAPAPSPPSTGGNLAPASTRAPTLPAMPAMEALPAARWDSRPEGRAWTRATMQALEANGQALVATVPADIDAYCPRYRGAAAEGRRAFWTGLLSALARFESGYDPATSFVESFNDGSGRPVVSRGLLQISIESGNGYRCGLADEQQLHDPATNLQCGVRIAARLVARDGVVASEQAPWRGMAAYWSPFRRADRRDDMKAWTAQQSYCRPE